MQCKQCGRENPEGVKFCGECGLSLQADAACSRKDLTDSAGAFRFDGGRDVDLKGLSNAQRVFEVAWRD